MSLRNPWAMAYGVLTVLFLGLCLAYFQAAPLQIYPDTERYQEVASQPLHSLDFWMGERPFTAPLVFKLAGNHPATIAEFQLVIGMLCWWVLAAVVAWMLRKPYLALVGYGMMLALGANLSQVMWHKQLLSESITDCTFVLALAGGLAAVETLRRNSIQPRQQLMIGSGLIALLVLFSFARDNHVYSLLGIAGLLILLVAAGRQKLRPVWPFLGVLIGGCLGVFVLQNMATLRVEHRLNILTSLIVQVEILTDAEKTAYFHALGLPLDDATLRGAGNLSTEQLFLKSAAEFQAWNTTKGRASYIRYLLDSPLTTLSKPFRRWGVVLNYDLYRHYLEIRPPSWQGPLSFVIYPKGYFFLAWAGVIIILGGWLLAHRRWDARWWLPLGVLILAYPQMLLLLHADPIDVVRHGANLSLQVRVALWLILLLAIENLRHIPRAVWAIGGVVIVVGGLAEATLRHNWLLYENEPFRWSQVGVPEFQAADWLQSDPETWAAYQDRAGLIDGAKVFNPAPEFRSVFSPYGYALKLHFREGLTTGERRELAELIASGEHAQQQPQLSPEQALLLDEWRASKSPDVLYQAGFEYLFFNGDWWAGTTDAEAAILTDPANYELMGYWSNPLQGELYWLYRVVGKGR